MTSIVDVARLAEVSTATASRVLSGSTYPVKPATRQRVLEAAEQLGFRFNMLARGLVTSRTHIIAAIVHDIADPYFGEVVRGLEDAARLADYQLLVSSSDRDVDRELAWLNSLLSYQVDGIVFAGGGIEDPRYEEELATLLSGFRNAGKAVVQLAPHAYPAPSVTVDDNAAAGEMTRYLFDLGHRRIGFIGGPERLRTSTVRVGGYRAALVEAGADAGDELVENGEFTSQGGAKAVSAFFDRDVGVTAVFAANDMMAFGAMHELRQRGVRVPEEVSVAGFDDVAMAAYMYSPLTTVHVPMYDLGREGMALALAILAGDDPPARRLPTRVVARASTAPPPRARSGRRKGSSGPSATAARTGNTRKATPT